MSVVSASTHASRAAIASLAGCVLLASFGLSSANIALPMLSREPGAGFAIAQWVVLAYLLTSTAMMVAAGRLGDLFGRRRLLLSGLALFGFASLCCALPDFRLLLAARAAQGVGAALMLALSMAMATDIAPDGRTGRAMGLLGAMSAIGTALGPSLGGLLLAYWHWRTLFLINAPAAWWLWRSACRHLPAGAPAKGDWRRFDFPGAALLALALFAYALCLSGGSRQPLPSAAIAALALAAFILRQQRCSQPILPLKVLREAALARGVIMSGLVACVMMTTLVVGPFHLHRALGLTPTEAGLAMAVGPVMSALAGVPAGRLTDCWGAGSMTLCGLLLMLLGTLLLWLLPDALGLAAYLGGLAPLTAGYALFQAANNTQVMGAAGPQRRGLFSGLLNLARNAGLISGAAMMGALFLAATGAAQPATAAPLAVARGMHITFMTAAAMVMLATLIASANLAKPQKTAV